MAKYILLLGVLLSLLIRIFFISQSKHTADIYLMYTMGATFLEGRNPYLALDFNVYPPLAIFLEAGSMLISSFLHLPFVTVFKFWPNLADFICAFIIYKFLTKHQVKPVKAALWSVFYLLNPISIIISSAHGQLDSITSLLVVGSIFMLTVSSIKLSSYLSALSLGMSIAIKANPAMLIPVFLLYKKTTVKQKIIYLILILTPLAITMFPFIWQDPQQVLVRIISYSGVADLSYAAILRGIWYQINAQTSLPLNSELLLISKFIFGAGAISLVLLFQGSKHLARACLAIYLLFLSFYFGIGSQYLVWIIPLAILEREKKLFIYTFLGGVALIGFYLFFGPDILLGKLSTIPPFQTKYIYLYFLGNLMFWLFILWWLIKIILSSAKILLPKFGPIRRKLILASLFLFIISLLPMIYLLIKLYNLYSLEQ